MSEHATARNIMQIAGKIDLPDDPTMEEMMEICKTGAAEFHEEMNVFIHADPFGPKLEVLEQMREDARPGSRLSFRKPRNADAELYGEGFAAIMVAD